MYCTKYLLGFGNCVTHRIWEKMYNYPSKLVSEIRVVSLDVGKEPGQIYWKKIDIIGYTKRGGVCLGFEI